MELSHLSDENLLTRFHKLVKTELKITHLILQSIAEIDRRKPYLERAYPNLYEFLVEGAGYSAAAAMRRIDGARLLRELPELAEKLESGAVNLTQVSKLQQAVRQVQKSSDQKLSSEVKLEILERLENVSERETQKILEETLHFSAELPSREIHHRDDTVTLTMTFSKEQLKELAKARNSVAHAAAGDWAEVISYLAFKENQRRQGKSPQTQAPQAPMINSQTTKPTKGESSQVPRTGPIMKPKAALKKATSAPEAAKHTKAFERSKINRFIPARIKKEIRSRDGSCQYRDPKTQKLCGSHRYLQIDHPKPIWAGGSNNTNNLQLLCANHNKMKYRKEAGIRGVY